jgi:hypothetical protein
MPAAVKPQGRNRKCRTHEGYGYEGCTKAFKPDLTAAGFMPAAAASCITALDRAGALSLQNQNKRGNNKYPLDLVFHL